MIIYREYFFPHRRIRVPRIEEDINVHKLTTTSERKNYGGRGSTSNVYHS